MTNSSRILLAIFIHSTGCALRQNTPKQEEETTLPPFVDTYVWHDFSVSKEKPFSEDGHYRLLNVRKNGDVELIDCMVETIATKIVVAKPLPKKLKKGETLPTVVVDLSDFDKQSAKCRELRTH